MTHWQVQDAKSRLSELIKNAKTRGPQLITRHGVEHAVVLSMADYHSLSGRDAELKEHLLGGPKFDDFEIERDSDAGREIEF